MTESREQVAERLYDVACSSVLPHDPGWPVEWGSAPKLILAAYRKMADAVLVMREEWEAAAREAGARAERERVTGQPEDAPVEQSARGFREDFEFKYLGGPMFAAKDDAQLERIAAEFEKRLAALLTSYAEARVAEYREKGNALDKVVVQVANGHLHSADTRCVVCDALAAWRALCPK
jgi:hypothetical protein